MTKRINKGQLIYEQLKKQIEAEFYRPGELLPTDMQLASEHETSRPTVAKSIQRLVDEGYLSRKAGLGTFLKADYPRESTRSDDTFGLLIPSLGQTEIFEPICGQIAQLADQYHFNLTWGGDAGQGSQAESAEKLARKYIAQNVDGVFFNPLEGTAEAKPANAKIVDLFSKAGIPVVLLDGEVSDALDVSTHDLVGIDNLAAGFAIGSHLLEQGCLKLAFVNRSHVASTVDLRCMGINEAVRRLRQGMASLNEMNCEGSLDDFAQEIMDRSVDAVVACNDALAVELMAAFERRNINIPKQLKIAGFDDVKYAKLLKIPLTTYRQPCADIASAAVEMMISRLKNPAMSPRKVMLLGELKQRTSTQM